MYAIPPSSAVYRPIRCCPPPRVIYPRCIPLLHSVLRNLYDRSRDDYDRSRDHYDISRDG